MAAAFDAEYAPEPGRPRNPATLAMPTSAPRRRATHRREKRLKRVHEPQYVGIEDGPEDREVLGVLGQRTARDAGVGDDDVGHAEARDEFAGGASERIRVAHVAGLCGRMAARQRGDERVELGLPPREEADVRTLRRVVPRERRAETAAGARDEDIAGTDHGLATGPVSRDVRESRGGPEPPVSSSAARRAPWRSAHR